MLSPKWLSGQGWGFGASAFAGRIPLSPDSDANGSPADGAGAPTPRVYQETHTRKMRITTGRQATGVPIMLGACRHIMA